MSQSYRLPSGGRLSGLNIRSWLGSLVAITVMFVVLCVTLFFILPALWMFVGSFRPTEDVANAMSSFGWGILIPTRLTFDNYIGLFIDNGFGVAIWNSAFVSAVSVVSGLLLSACAAYGLAVFRFPCRKLVFSVIVVSFMVPFEAIAIPLSQQFQEWHLGNSLIGLILPGIGNGLAIFNLRQHFLGIPPSYREAGMIDGASEPRILFTIYCRMSGPALVNSAVLIFIGQWTAYLWPLLIASDHSLQVAPVALASTFGEHGADFGRSFAGAIMLSAVPAMTMLLCQKFLGRLDLTGGEK